MKILKSWLPLIISLILIIYADLCTGQGPGDPPPPPGGHGRNSHQDPGGGAPLGSGVGILIGLGTVYAFRKYYNGKKKHNLMNKAKG